MSNYRAVATVTATLQRILTETVATSDVDQASVTVGQPVKPSEPAPAAQINLCIYHVAYAQAWRNETLPRRTAAGVLRERPAVALELFYLLSFYGNEATFEPQRLLGLCSTRLNEMPVLSKTQIEGAIQANSTVLGQSDLAQAPEPVRLTAINLTIDESARLWSVFFQVPQALSLAYQASVVVLESEQAGVAPLPVLTPRLGLLPLRRPRIDNIVDDDGARAITAASRLRITGDNLLGAQTKVHIDSQSVPIASTIPPTAQRTDQLTIPLADLATPLDAGVHTVRVEHQTAVATAGETSNLVPFVLQPTIDLALNGADLTVTIAPPLQPTQSARLLLDPAASTGTAAYGISVSVDAPQASVTLSVADVPAGPYLVRLEVDGVSSPLVVDDDPASPTYRTFIGPNVTVAAGGGP